MVRGLDRVRPGSLSGDEISPATNPTSDFPVTAPAANPVFFRTYSRFTATGRETWQDVCTRTLQGLVKLGKLTDSEADVIDRMQRQVKAMPSGRWLWVGGSNWLEQPQNFSGAYNCTSTNVCDWAAFALMMDLAMMGCGTGAILEPDLIDKLPVVKNRLNVVTISEIGKIPMLDRQELTTVEIAGDRATIKVGDSRQGWVQSYKTLLELSSDDRFNGEVEVAIDLSNVRPAGEQLKGFGGMANPVKLPELYGRCAQILTKAIGRQLNSVECCLLIDEAAVTIVAGNIRRCLPTGALVHTESGLVPIEKIRIGDRVLTSKGFYPVTNFFDQGEQSLCRIKTQDSYFECTADHKVAVLTDVYGNYEMVKARDLKLNDRLVFVPQSIPGTATELPEFKGELAPHTKRISIPALTTDVAYFFGYLHGDGSVASDGWRVRFRVAEHQQQILEKLISVGELFGLDTHTLRTPEQCQAKAFELQFNSAALNQYLSQFKQPFESISVPDSILLGTKAIREAYLAGLADADGCYSQGVLVASVHSNFLHQIQTLYASLGVTTRLCSSVRKRTGKWEGELVTVGEKSFDDTAVIFQQYSLIFAERHKERPISFKDHGFPKEMVKPLVNTYQYGWSGHQKQMIVSTLKKFIPEATNLIPVKVESVEMDARTSHTYDIEVATIHEFVCEGILVSNSAGMRQFNDGDKLGATAKDNLWQQDENGNWRIDPERDSLRMANHTRVFHHKPTLEECVAAVQKQYHSGEGAIQWAGEAVARSNADLLNTPELKANFLKVYAAGTAKAWLQSNYANLDENEIDHRLSRFGLNPCVTADTWVHTDSGAKQVQDLIGIQHGTYINGELFSTTKDGFFYSGTKPVVKLQTKEGYQLRLTANHQVLKVTSQTQKSQYTQWVEAGTLKLGDRVLIHNHRNLVAWDGSGTAETGWLLGSLIGDGCFATYEASYSAQAKLRFWGDTQVEMKEYALQLVKSNVVCADALTGLYNQHNKYYEISSAGLRKLAAEYDICHGHKTITPKVESASYDFYCGFLRGLFDADGSVQGTQQKGISVRLAQSNLELLEAVQRMLLRIGIASTIYQNRRDAGMRMLPDSNRELAEYYCQAQHELVIANDNLATFQSLVGFKEPLKAERLATLIAGYQRKLNRERFTATISVITADGEEAVFDCTVPGPARFDANGFVAHNCGEILGTNFHCNLSEVHLNQVDPNNYQEQRDAFTASALSVAALLNHKFQEPRYQYSRELDPIVGVSFTGLFDFFVHAFGAEWLEWWAQGRPATAAGIAYKQKEHEYLNTWRQTVEETVWNYCDKHGIKRPNRCTTVQPSGTKSLLTGASPGWHPPKAQRFIRRITFRKNDPVALACIDYGYSVIPSQSDKDDAGNLLNDAYDPRCTEWLIEIPVAVSWADVPGADMIDISQFSALTQMDFYMGVQQKYVRHNTSATIELREHEVDALGKRIYEAIRDDEGYISAALLARFDDHQTFPRLPFEPIDKATYDELMVGVSQRRQTAEFHTALSRYDLGNASEESGPAGCDSDKCLLPDIKPNT